MPANDAAVLSADQVRGANGILVLAKKVQAESLANGAADDLIAVSRFGVGFDSVDIEACTKLNVVSTLQPFMCSLSCVHHTITQDQWSNFI